MAAKVPLDRGGISQLSLWARVALAARCARRVEPLHAAAPPKLRRKERPFQQLLELAETAAARGSAEGLVDPAEAERLAASGPGGWECASVEWDEADVAPEMAPEEAYRAARAAGSSAMLAASASALAPECVAAAATEAVLASAEAAGWLGGRAFWKLAYQAMADDAATLARAQKAAGWTDATPVAADFFGPLWPSGAPKGWDGSAVRVSESSTAPPEHVEVARGGARAIDEWRRANGSRKAVLSLKRADLRGLDLSGADLTDADFTQAELRGADLTGAKLVRTIFDEADLSEAWLGGTRIEDASFVRVKLDATTFDGASIRAGGASGFHEATGRGTMFRGARFRKTRAIKCRLIEADFTEAALDDCEFQGCRFTRARFERASISRSDFARSEFVECVFDGAEFEAVGGEAMSFSRPSFADCSSSRSPAVARRMGRANAAPPAYAAKGGTKRAAKSGRDSKPAKKPAKPGSAKSRDGSGGK